MYLVTRRFLSYCIFSLLAMAGSIGAGIEVRDITQRLKELEQLADHIKSRAQSLPGNDAEQLELLNNLKNTYYSIVQNLQGTDWDVTSAFEAAQRAIDCAKTLESLAKKMQELSNSVSGGIDYLSWLSKLTQFVQVKRNYESLDWRLKDQKVISTFNVAATNLSKMAIDSRCNQIAGYEALRSSLFKKLFDTPGNVSANGNRIFSELRALKNDNVAKYVVIIGATDPSTMTLNAFIKLTNDLVADNRKKVLFEFHPDKTSKTASPEVKEILKSLISVINDAYDQYEAPQKEMNSVVYEINAQIDALKSQSSLTNNMATVATKIEEQISTLKKTYPNNKIILMDGRSTPALNNIEDCFNEKEKKFFEKKDAIFSQWKRFYIAKISIAIALYSAYSYLFWSSKIGHFFKEKRDFAVSQTSQGLNSPA